jgi:predicted Zn-dependent protease
MARIGTVLAIVLFISFLAVPLLAGPISTLVPVSVETTVGSQMIDSLGKDAKFCRDEAGLQALDGLVDTLVATRDTDYAFKVYVAEDDVLNAFAAPGGHVILYRPIIEKADNPEEVAGVLAHELAHVIEGHPRRGMVEALGYGVFRLLTPGDSLGAELTQVAVASKYSRDDELEADRSGALMLTEAGIDSRGLLTFFDRLAAEGEGMPGALEFISTHPTGDHRKEALADLATEGGPAMTAEEWKALQNVCSATGEMVAVGDEPRP